MRILVFQHLAVEHPGVLRDFWGDAGHEWTAVELDEGEPIPDLARYDLMVAMGGPMDVWQEDLHPWLVPEKAAIRRWVVELGRPYLGVCLGHQLLASALHAPVGLMAGPEVGLSDVAVNAAGRKDPVFAALGDAFQALHWHGAEVSRLPEGAVTLASTPATPIQAMRWGRHAYGVQCHIEITETTVAEWGAIPEYKASLEAALGADGAAQLARDVVRGLPRFNAAARAINDALFACIDAPSAV